MVARMATYRFRVDPHDLAKKAEAGLLPNIHEAARLP